MPHKSATPIALLVGGGLLFAAAQATAAGDETIELNSEAGASAVTVDPSATEPATIDGFRSARFGMTEDEVLAAIAADFGLGVEAITTGVNPLEKTTSLGVTVTDLVPDSGDARVVYIFGYESQALIQVNIVWGADPATDPEQIRTAASLLVSYFRNQNYDPEKTAIGVPLANGALLAFYAEDADGSSVTLTVASRPAEEGAADETAEEGSEEQAPERLLMQLSYVGDFANPDIFRLAPGSF